MIPVQIKDAYGGGNELRVNDDGGLGVTVQDHPPSNDVKLLLPLRDFFTDSLGDNDMRVVGSLVNPLPFSIRAEEERDVWVKYISVVIADSGASLNNFGNIGALTNGVCFKWSTQATGDVIINEGLKSNFDFVRLAGGNPAFGTGNSSFKANNVEGSSEAYLAMIDVSLLFGMKWGFRLRKGTKDALSFVMQDDVSGVDRFDAVAYGSRY